MGPHEEAASSLVHDQCCATPVNIQKRKKISLTMYTCTRGAGLLLGGLCFCDL